MRLLLALFFSVLVLLLNFRVNADPTDTVDQDALVNFYLTITNPLVLGWDTNVGLCGQNGIYCTGTTVTDIFLSSRGMVGVISPSLFDLPSLKTLDLSDNQLFGEIKANIGNLKELYYLTLQKNLLSGQLPTEIGNLALQYLDLQGNSFSGTIPTELCKNQGLTRLDLSANQISGSIPTEINMLWNLLYLDLGNNELSGDLPPLSITLNHLDISSNLFSGTFPTGLLSMYLHVINLRNNSFEGAIPDGLSIAGPIHTLDLSFNKFNGSFPSSLLAYTMKSFGASFNQLTGSLPTSYNSALTFLDLSHNGFTGTIPAEIAVATSLNTLILTNNLLIGPISTHLEALNLTTLQLDSNHLTGTVPAFLELLGLDTLLLANNGLCPVADYSLWATVQDYLPTSCEACLVYTCQNGGTCSGGTNELFSCSCDPNYSGDNCEIYNYCVNGDGDAYTQTCTCYSGFTGSNCIIDSRGSCAPLAPADPHGTEEYLTFSQEQSSISNGIATLVFLSPATAGRLVDLAIGQCHYPEIIVKGFQESTCSDVYSLVASLDDLFFVCDFGLSEEDFVVLDGFVNAEILDQVATFQGVPVSRRVFSQIRLDVSLPKVHSVSANPALISTPNPFAFITEQQYSSWDDIGIVTLSMAIVWPYSFGDFQVTATSPPNLLTDFAFLVTLNTDHCKDDDFTKPPCLTLVTITISNVASSEICSLNGTYTLSYNIYCGEAGCPFPSAAYQFDFILVSDHLCSSKLIATQLGYSMETFSDSGHSDSASSFGYGARMYMAITVASDVDLASMEISRLTLSQDGSPPMDVVLNDVVVSPLDTTLEYTTDLADPNVHWISFTLSTGIGAEYLLTPGSLSQAVFTAEIKVTYDIEQIVDRKRDARESVVLKARKSISLTSLQGVDNAVLMNQNH